jgi:ABC-type branched-subunit amino acid transport system substrate-binding protein
MRAVKGRRAVGAAALALALAGCSTASNGNSSVSATGQTLTIYVSAPAGCQVTAGVASCSNHALADTINAEQLAFAQDAHAVTAYTLRMHVITEGELSSHARQAISDKGAIAYIGELAPADSEQTVGITNAQDLLQVSPGDTALELTQTTPAVPTGRPKYFLESSGTYGRTFARIVPNSAVEAKATIAELKALGVSSVYINSDASFYGQAMADALRTDAAGASVSVSTSPASAGAIFYAAEPSHAAAAAVKLMGYASQNPSATLFGTSSLDTPAFVQALSTAPAHLYISTPGVLSSAEPAAYTQFASAFSAKYGHQPASEAAFGYESMTAVIGVIAKAGRNGNNRRTVGQDFFHITNRPSAVGTYSIDSGGDSNLTSFVFNHVKNGVFVPATSAQG